MLSPTGCLLSQSPQFLVECSSEEKPRGAALQSVLGSQHQESCVSSSSVLTSASQKLPAERNQEICQARSAVRVVCTSQHCVRRTSKEEGRTITSPPHKQQYNRPGRTGQQEGCPLQNCQLQTGGKLRLRNITTGLASAAIMSPHYLPACLPAPLPHVCTPLPQLPCFCTWRMGSGIRYLQQDWTRRTAVSRHTLWPTEI